MGEIYKMNSNGSDVKRLTFNNSLELGPNWSPDGSKIVFGSNREGFTNIYTMDADGSNQIPLTTILDCAYSCGSGVWSPDGTRIAYVSQMGHHVIIFTIHPDGTGKEVVVAEAHGAEWSPDGSQIAYTPLYNPGWIYAVDVSGPYSPTLLVGLDGIGSYAWSPNGGQFALSINTEPNFNFEIYLYDLATSASQRLTYTQNNHNAVSWSPTGEHLMFTTMADGYNSQIFTMDTAGGMVTNLSHNSFDDQQPDWTR